MLSRYKYGIFSEWLAKTYLQFKLYKIIEARFKTKFAEIDLIASRKNCLIFIEVKSRKNLNPRFHPINNQQLLRIRRAAEYFIYKHQYYSGFDIRFDYIEINLPFIKHFTNAF
jgi:putative endonuclease